MDWNNMKKSLEALYVLDNALTDPENDYLRLVRKTENGSEIRYVIDNGAGDTLHVIFTPEGILIKGFDHENDLNQFSADEWNQSVIDHMYEVLDPKLVELFPEEERDFSTFVIWYDGTPHQNAANGNDGGGWLLDYAYDTYEEFKEFVEGYYERKFDEGLLKKLYEQGMLSQEEQMKLVK